MPSPNPMKNKICLTINRNQKGRHYLSMYSYEFGDLIMKGYLKYSKEEVLKVAEMLKKRITNSEIIDNTEKAL